MGSFFTAILGKIAGFAQWFLAVFLQIFKDIWNVLTDAFCWLLDGLLGVGISALQAIDIPFNPSTYYAMLPEEVINMLGLIKVPQAISIIVSALIIRFILQTIPFVRWGS